MGQIVVGGGGGQGADDAAVEGDFCGKVGKVEVALEHS